MRYAITAYLYVITLRISGRVHKNEDLDVYAPFLLHLLSVSLSTYKSRRYLSVVCNNETRNWTCRYRISLLQSLICIGRVDVVASISTAILMKPVILRANSPAVLSLTVEAFGRNKNSQSCPAVCTKHGKFELTSKIKCGQCGVRFGK